VRTLNALTIHFDKKQKYASVSVFTVSWTCSPHCSSLHRKIFSDKGWMDGESRLFGETREKYKITEKFCSFAASSYIIN